MTAATKTTKAQMKDQITNALNNYHHIDCHICCCRVYLEFGMPDVDIFKITNEEAKALKASHKKSAAAAMKVLAEMGYRTINKRVYFGYDNASGIVYSQASAIEKALRDLGIFFLVEAEED